MSAIQVVLIAAGGISVWLVKVAVETIVRNEYNGWGAVLARWLVRVASALWKDRKDEWIGELEHVQGEAAKPGIDVGLAAFAGAVVFRGRASGGRTLAFAMVILLLPLIVANYAASRVGKARLVNVLVKVPPSNRETKILVSRPESKFLREVYARSGLGVIMCILSVAKGHVSLRELALAHCVRCDGYLVLASKGPKSDEFCTCRH